MQSQTAYFSIMYSSGSYNLKNNKVKLVDMIEASRSRVDYHHRPLSSD